MEYYFAEKSHRSVNWVMQFLYGKRHKVEWDIWFDDMFRAEPETVQQEEQINKLPGITDGILRHRNEFQFGWRNSKNKDEIDIFCYFWINGKRPSLPEVEKKYKIATVKTSRVYRFRIEVTKDSVVYTWINNDYQVSTWVPYKFKNRFSWLLQPWIGGKETYDDIIVINSHIVKSNNKIFTIFEKN